jgi:hypothetical protein
MAARVAVGLSLGLGLGFLPLAGCGPGDSQPPTPPPVNATPVQVHFLAPAGPLTVRAGSVLRFNVTARKGTVTSVLLEASQLPTGATYDPTSGDVTYRPDYDQLGPHLFEFRDATSGGTASTRIDVKVVPLGWRALSTSVAVPVEGPVVVDPVEAQLLAFGPGGTIFGRPLDTPGATTDSTGQPDASGWVQLRSAGSGPSAPETALIDGSSRRAVVLSGGLAEAQVLDLRTYTWAQVKGVAPSSRTRYASAVETGGARAFFFGGVDDQGPLNDLYSIDLTQGAWSSLKPIGAAPLRRAGAGLLFDTPRSRLMIAGGDAGFFGETSLLRDVWHVTFSARRLSWAELTPAGPPPPARADFTSAHDVLNDRLLMWGGVAEAKSAMDNPWELRVSDPEEWSPLVAAGAPQAAATHASFDDVVGRVVMLVAPNIDSSAGGPYDLWELSF